MIKQPSLFDQSHNYDFFLFYYRTKKIILVQNKKDTEAIDRDERIEMNSQIHHRSSLSISFKGTCSSSIILLLALFTIALGFQPSLKRHLRLQQFINIPKYQIGSTKYQYSRRVLFSSNEDYEYDEAPGRRGYVCIKYCTSRQYGGSTRECKMRWCCHSCEDESSTVPSMGYSSYTKCCTCCIE